METRNKSCSYSGTEI